MHMEQDARAAAAGHTEKLSRLPVWGSIFVTLTFSVRTDQYIHIVRLLPRHLLGVWPVTDGPDTPTALGHWQQGQQ